MPRGQGGDNPSTPRYPFLHTDAARDFGALALLALANVLVHTVASNRYGFHRDELLTFENARHPAWGYAVYPPLTPFLARVALETFGTSLRGFRLFGAISQGLMMLLTGLATRELGGKREAQLLAALAAGIAGPSLVHGSFLSYTSFDNLWWVLAACFVIRLLKTGDARWWVGVGAAIGLGLMTKYTIGFLVIGIAGATLLTPARRHLKSPWLWCGATVALLVAMPNVVWQVRHHFVSLEFVKSIHERDIGRGWTDFFLLNQLWKCTNCTTVPLWCAGLWYVFKAPEGGRYRMVGWMYVVTLAALLLARGRDYYLAPAYPMLFAAGAVQWEKWLSAMSIPSQRAARRVTWQVLAVAVVLGVAVTVPYAPLGSAWWRLADVVNGGNFNSQVGWPDMVESVARIRDSLPARDRAALAVWTGDDGETGAISLYGPSYGLPRTISGMNSGWMRGYGDPPPETVITVGMDPEFLRRSFESCEVAGRVTSRSGISNYSLSSYPELYVCRHLRQPWPEFWKTYQYFG